MSVLIIIPAFNEAQNITKLLNNISSLESDYDVLVINDASHDNTSFIAKNLGFTVADLPINLGIGGAMQTGYLYAYYNSYDIAVQVDGDGQHDPQYIKKLITPIVNKEADMVIGSRFIDRVGFQSSFLRRMGIVFFQKLICLLTGKNFTDPTSGFRACNKAIIAYFARYYPFDYPEPETLVAMNRQGFQLAEVPVVMKEREKGQSSIQSLKSLYYMLKVTLAIIIDMAKNREEERYAYDGTKATAISHHS